MFTFNLTSAGLKELLKLLRFQFGFFYFTMCFSFGHVESVIKKTLIKFHVSDHFIFNEHISITLHFISK